MKLFLMAILLTILYADTGFSKRRRGQCKCGRGAQNRIIGGQYADKNEFPWMARIYGGCASLCGGALISNRHILTAYHCLMRSSDTKPCDHSDGKRKAVLGSNVVTYDGMFYAGTAGGISLKKFVYPPNAGLAWNSGPEAHDIAIYILDRPVTFSSKIQPICLPAPGTSYAGEPAIVAGWGDYRKGNHPNSERLRKVSQKVHGVVRGRRPFISTEIQTTWNGTPMDPCSGDSGGPLMWMDNVGRFRIIGTVEGGGFNCDANYQATSYGDKRQKYNNVMNYLGWIKDVIKKSRKTDRCAIVD